ncbi:MAG TPA: hypothetical protein VF293_04770, partial [Candidatus Limnocylindrales bacterium]
DLENAIGQAEARMHDDRRTPSKSLQSPHTGAPRVVSLSAGSLATDGLPDLTESSVAPAETDRSTQRYGKPVAASDGGPEPGVDAV